MNNNTIAKIVNIEGQNFFQIHPNFHLEKTPGLKVRNTVHLPDIYNIPVSKDMFLRVNISETALKVDAMSQQGRGLKFVGKIIEKTGTADEILNTLVSIVKRF